MDEFFDIPTLIVIGLAIVVLFRLRSVLGTRTGNERTPLERRTAAPKPAGAEAREETVVPLRPTAPMSDGDAERRARRVASEIESFSGGNAAVAEGLKAIADADPNFTPKSFIDGANQAYEMVVTAFAEGDRKTLKNLLERDVYDGFESAIAEREAAGHTIDFTFVGLPKVVISEAALDKRDARVVVNFNAEMVSATRDKDGAIIEGDTEQVQSIADEWTFARSPKSRDPNWKLVATNQLT